MMKSKLLIILFAGILIAGCINIEQIFERESPHDKYSQMLVETGAAETALGKKWIDAAEKSLYDSLFISIPYKEEGYFFPDEAKAVSYRFNGKRGEKILVYVEVDTTDPFKIFIDVFAIKDRPEKVDFADEARNIIEYTVEEEGEFLLRLQPELLKGGNYNLSIKE
jgi:peptidoglycan LD-endopeptidase LytH